MYYILNRIQMTANAHFSDKDEEKVLSTKLSKVRRCLAQIIAVCVKNELLLVYGLTLGVPTMLIPNLSGGVPGESIVLGEDGISWIGSLNYLSVPLGCLISGAGTRPFGRIKSLQAISLLFCGSFLLFHFASQAWHIFLGLFLTGFSGGLLEAPTLIYTVEITEPSLRGALSSTSTLAIVIGVMTSFILGTVFSWRKMALINACIPLVGLVLMFFIPESPYWLISKNRKDEAKKNLAWLRGWVKIEAVEQEFLNICSELKKLDCNENNEEPQIPIFNLTTIKLYLKSTFIKPYLLITLTFVLAHFGITPINIYAIKIFQVLQAPIDSYYATVMIGTTELLGSILLMVLVRYLGKRVLAFISLAGISICFLFTGIYSYNIGASHIDSTSSIIKNIATDYNWVPLLTVVSVGFFSYLMTYSLPWIIMGELYPNEVRDTGSGLSAGTGYIIGFFANKTFLNLVNIVSLYGVFWFYSCVALLGLVLLYFMLPETEGKTLFEITEHYAGNGKLNNKVLRRSTIGNGVINKGFTHNEVSDLDTRL